MFNYISSYWQSSTPAQPPKQEPPASKNMNMDGMTKYEIDRGDELKQYDQNR